MAEQQKYIAPKAPEAIVYGGTTPTSWDRREAERKADAKKRRAEEDERRRLGRASAAGQLGPGTHAMQKTLPLGGSQTHDTMVLAVRDPKSQKILEYQTCELIDQGKLPNGEADLLLLVVCMRCLYTLGRVDDNNITLRTEEGHFGFEACRIPAWAKRDIDTVSGRWINPTNLNQVVKIPGTVNTRRVIRCPAYSCGWRFQIDDSVMVAV